MPNHMPMTRTKFIPNLVPGYRPHVHKGQRLASRGGETRRTGRRPSLTCSATKATEVDVVKAIGALKAAADLGLAEKSSFTLPNWLSADRAELCRAMLTLEDARLDPAEWLPIIGGDKSPGKVWRLVFTVNTEKARATKNGESEGGGTFFPVTAAQRFDADAMRFENGVFLGGTYVLSFTFGGPISWSRRKLEFMPDCGHLRIGPLKIPLDALFKSSADDKKKPFFMIIYADDDILVARGRAGGLAYWARCSPSEILQRGIIYGA